MGRQQSGFTLLELTVALGLFMLMSGLLASEFAPWLAFQQKLDTDQRLERAGRLWTGWFDLHAAELELDPQRAGMPLSGHWLPDGTVVTPVPWRDWIVAAIGSADPVLFEDGFHQPWVLRVSRGLSVQEDGVTLHFHRMALLSPGGNGQLETGTQFDAERGVLQIVGDDRGFVVDGLPLVRARRAALEQRLERAARAWQDWFHVRWEGDPERDASVDYFASACPGSPLASAWDSATGALPPVACDAGADPAAPGAALGLSLAELADANGGRLQFDSRSVDTRNPEHPDPALRTPPYSAIVSGSLPGGTALRRTALGTL